MSGRPAGVSVWSRLWIAPAVGAGLAILLGAGTLWLDQTMRWVDAVVPVFSGSRDSARTLLQAIAGSATTLLALVFTIIAVVVQLASGEYSPRALRPLVRDRPTHLTIGILVGTFTFALLGLLALDGIGAPEADRVQSLTVTTGFVLAVVTIGTFAVYSNHIVHAVRVQKILERLGGVAVDLVEREIPEEGESLADQEVVDLDTLRASAAGRLVRAREAGVVVHIDADALVEEARRAGVVFRLVPGIGGFVRTDGPLVEVIGTDPGGGADPEPHIELASERTLSRDVIYSLRLLVDVGTRSLSPGDHDPTSAVQAIDHIHELLARLVVRPLPTGRHRDDEGAVRLLVPVPAWADYVHLAVDELRRLGADKLQVSRRLLDMLDDLIGLAPAERRPPLEEQRDLLRRAAEDGASSGHDRLRAVTADRGGLGL
jgi:uncharacterized membrane protein